MKEASASQQRPSHHADGQVGVLDLWHRFLSRDRGLLTLAVMSGVVGAFAGGFGMPLMMNTVLPVIFGDEQLQIVLPEMLGVICDVDWLNGVLNAWLQGLLVWLGGASGARFGTVIGAAAFLPAVVLVAGVAKFGNAYWLNKAGLRILERVRLGLYRRLQQLSLTFHDKNRSGDLMARVMNDTQGLQMGMTQVAADLIIQPLTMLAAASYLAYKALTSADLGMLMVNMVLLGVCIVPVQKFGKRLLAKARIMQGKMGSVMTMIQENLAAQRDVRAFGLEEHQIGLLRAWSKEMLRVLLSVAKIQSSLPSVIEIVSAVALGITLYWASSSAMTLGEFVAIAMAMYMCYEPIKKMGTIHNRIKMMSVSLGRIDEVLYAADDVPDPATPATLQNWRGEVEFRGVSFAYNEEHEVMHEMTVRVPAGQTVALVGPSGAGKTTFINLLCRFYDASHGEVLLDGVNVKNLLKADILAHVALVSQHPVLFRGSLADNILIGKPTATQAELAEAGRMAAVNSFLQEDDAGYGRLLGESGDGLSGGQKQRVSIARAFLKDAPILILDEATASLDMRSEELIQNEIDQLANNRTTFIIAHRFSTIRKADRILVLENGCLVGDGSHDELYAKSPLYKGLYDQQIAEEIRESSKIEFTQTGEESPHGL